MPIKFQEVYDFIKEYGCILIIEKQEYQNQIQKLKIKCKCNNIYYTSFDTFKKSRFKCCKKCGYLERDKSNLEKYGVKNIGELKRYTYKEVKDYYKRNNCELLSKNYENAHDILEYRCSCGNINQSRFCDFKNKNSRCINCGKEKRKETCLEKYGVEYTLQSEEIRQKIKETNLQKYGVENPFQNEEIKEKIKETNLQKYGVENPSQNKEVFKKTLSKLYSAKEYTFPSGVIKNIQGYENLALDILLKKYKEEEIIVDTNSIPSFSYILKNKKRVYHPDIFVSKDNKIIEVKSIYTYLKDLEKNLCKMKQVEKSGYIFEFWIFHKNILLTKKEIENLTFLNQLPNI